MPQAELDLAGRERPRERGADVVVLLVEPLEPRRLVGARRARARPPRRAARKRSAWRRCRSSSSPRSSSRSSAYSRIVSSMLKRGSPSAPSELPDEALVDERGERRRAPRRARARRSPQTASAASSEQPPTKTPSRANSACSASVEQVVAPVDRVAQRLLALGQVDGAAGEEVEAAARAAPRIACGESSFTRAAASSIASGSPSRRTADLGHRGRVLVA